MGFVRMWMVSVLTMKDGTLRRCSCNSARLPKVRPERLGVYPIPDYDLSGREFLD